MKGLIKNITDVITNSSSEVFVMNENNALYYDRLEDTLDCIYIEEINWDWIENQGYYEQSMVMDMCIDKLTDEERLNKINGEILTENIGKYLLKIIKLRLKKI